MKWVENYKTSLKKKTKWSWISDIFFIVLIIALLFPTTRTPLIVFLKRVTLVSPSIPNDAQYGTLSQSDLQWTLINKENQFIQLKDLTDKPIFLNIWATWCAPCIAEMPSIEKLYIDYKDDVHFVIASYEDADIINSFLEKQQLNLPVFRYRSEEPLLLHSKTIPATFIINKNGKIVLIEKGTSNWNSEKVRSFLDQLIDQ